MAYRLHVWGENDLQKRLFFKYTSQSGLKTNAYRFCVDGRKVRFENTMMSYIVQRIFWKGCYRNSIVLAFSCGQVKTIQTLYERTRISSETEEKNPVFLEISCLTFWNYNQNEQLKIVFLAKSLTEKSRCSNIELFVWRQCKHVPQYFFGDFTVKQLLAFSYYTANVNSSFCGCFHDCDRWWPTFWARFFKYPSFRRPEEHIAFSGIKARTIIKRGTEQTWILRHSNRTDK